MAELDLQVQEPLLERETVEDALEKCRDVIEKAEGGGMKRFAWPLVKSGIADAVQQSASTDRIQWLARGWAFAKELKAFKDPAQYPPDETAMLKLGDHELSGAFQPVVTLSCEGVTICKLDFEVPITGLFHAVSVSIRNGKIIAFGGGECDLTVLLKFRDVDLTGPVSVKKLQLPGKREFAEPISIP